MNRRDFLRNSLTAIGVAGSGGALSGCLSPPTEEEVEEFKAVLVDTTLCVGCRTCEEACATANGLPDPNIDAPDWEKVFEKYRNPSPTQFSVINRFETEEDEIFVKKQCMHCNQPACAAACLTKAMLKTQGGAVIWRGNKCMGCRFCMLSCPFDMPKYEYDSWNPRVRKCTLCFQRLEEGEEPACVEECPEEAIIFGPRRELLEEARTRIYSDPEAYVHHIYGEREAGGTGWLYLAGIPFEELGFNTEIEPRPYPELAKGFLYSVPFIFILWPSFLLGLSRATQPEEQDEHDRGH
jgi:Fe-S-cluster-containing dehydrogenase component